MLEVAKDRGLLGGQRHLVEYVSVRAEIGRENACDTHILYQLDRPPPPPAPPFTPPPAACPRPFEEQSAYLVSGI
jgi:hypothetical protein